jgi:hypothetical protein
VDPETGIRFIFKNSCFNEEYQVDGKKGVISLKTRDRHRAVQDYIQYARFIINNFKDLNEDTTFFAAKPYLLEHERVIEKE